MTSLPSGVEDDPTRMFWLLLPDHLIRVEKTQRIIAAIHACVQPRGPWTMPQLVAEVSRDMPPGRRSYGGLLTFRLERAVELGPPKPDGPVRFVQPLKPCGECDGSPARWVEAADGSAVSHCRRCWTNPKAVAHAEG